MLFEIVAQSQTLPTRKNLVRSADPTRKVFCMSDRLKDKCILITGSATGIGAAMARRFVAEGARVIIHGIDTNEQIAVGQKLASELGNAAFAHFNDLSKPESAPELVNFAVKRFGRLDGLVNNAAISPRANLYTTDAALFDKIFAINTRAQLLMIQAAMPHLI